MDRGAWRATVHGVAKSWTQLNNWMNGWNELKSTKVKASLVAQRVKHLPPMWETSVRSLGREDPVEKEMATHSSILGWRIPQMEEPGRLESARSQRIRHD